MDENKTNVVNENEQNETVEPSMKDMMEQIDNSFKDIKRNDILKATIISVNENDILVDLGYYADGIIPFEELGLASIQEMQENFKPGDIIDAMVLRLDDGDGNVRLSKKQADLIVVWDDLQTIYDQDRTINVTVNEVVKGGVTTSFKGVRAFIPASQLSVDYVDDLAKFVGTTMAVKLIEYNADDKKVIFSRKIVELKERQEMKTKLLNEIEKGQKFKGTVKRLTNFGAFVDIGGIDGLIHISDLSWKKVKHPSDIVNEGDVVEVYVLDYDKEKQRIALGLKDVNEDPWNNLDTHKVGSIEEGTVTKLMPFGAFVQLSDGLEGLVHISEISENRINRPSEVLEQNQNVKVKILALDKQNKKISLSIKKTVEEDVNIEIPTEYSNKDESMATLGDLLKGKFDGLIK